MFLVREVLMNYKIEIHQASLPSKCPLCFTEGSVDTGGEIWKCNACGCDICPNCRTPDRFVYRENNRTCEADKCGYTVSIGSTQSSRPTRCPICASQNSFDDNRANWKCRICGRIENKIAVNSIKVNIQQNKQNELETRRNATVRVSPIPITPISRLWQSFLRLHIGVRVVVGILLFGLCIYASQGVPTFTSGEHIDTYDSAVKNTAASSVQPHSNGNDTSSANSSDHSQSNSSAAENDVPQSSLYQSDSSVNGSVSDKERSEPESTANKASSEQSTNQDLQSQVMVPDIKNMKEADAVKRLSDIGLRVKVEYKDAKSESLNGTVDSCNVIGKSLNVGDEVIIVVLRNTTIVVPDVTGLTESKAKSTLEALGVSVRVNTNTMEDQRLDGKVIDCSNIGEPVNKGTTVTITVAVYPYVEVPNVMHLTEQKAKEKLLGAGLYASVSYEEVYNKSEDGIVLNCDVIGEMLNRGSSVRIVVGAYSIVTVPRVTGKKESEATSTLRGLGLSVSVEYQDVYEQSRGNIVLECNETGDELEKGSTVTIVVGRYVEYVKVPDVIGAKEILAKNRLTNAGFRVSVRYYNVDDSDDDGCVIECEESGEEMEKGSTIIIYVGRYNND